jgi:hypothetical protein
VSRRLLHREQHPADGGAEGGRQTGCDARGDELAALGVGLEDGDEAAALAVARRFAFSLKQQRLLSLFATARHLLAPPPVAHPLRDFIRDLPRPSRGVGAQRGDAGPDVNERGL